jgi:hypothetical protein
MQNRLISTMLTISVASFLSATAALAGDQDFTLTNKTGYTISEVYVSPSKSSEWEEDVLGQAVLADGDNVEIKFSRATTSCKWDLKVVYDDKETAEWDGFDLCTISKISISYNRKSGETWATSE